MSRSSKPVHIERYTFPNTRQLWHDAEKFTSSLGCNECHYRKQCGGLQIEAQVFDCTSFCRCVNPEKCDNVCSKNPRHFVARVQEVNSLGLENAPGGQKLPHPDLPSLIPLIYHSDARIRAPSVGVVALSLFELFDKRTGTLRFQTREDLALRFGISVESNIVLSGTDTDPPLERWWRLTDRAGTARALANLGVKLITAPNFSLFDDVPRFDNLYNVKRIAICSSEIQFAGVQCAVHVNARTDRDWDNWISFLTDHSEYSFVSFEFGTGAGARPRFPWHVKQLCRLARSVPHPLHLVARGGIPAFPDLGKAFDSVSLVDTASFVRAHRRRKAILSPSGLSWEQSLTEVGQPIDDLLEWNISRMSEHICSLLGPKSRSLVQLKRASTSTDYTRDESLDASGLIEASSH